MKRLPLIFYAISTAGVFLPNFGPVVVMLIGFASVIMYANLKKFGMMTDGNLFKVPEKQLEQSHGEKVFMKSSIAIAFGGFTATIIKIVYWNLLLQQLNEQLD